MNWSSFFLCLLPVVHGASSRLSSYCEELVDLYSYTSSSDLDFGQDSDSQNSIVNLALAFDVSIEPNATVTQATIQFRASASGSDSITVRIYGEANLKPSSFGSSITIANVTSRIKTNTYVDWKMPSWTAGDVLSAQRSPDLSPILQELVLQPQWTSATTKVVFIVKRVQDTGVRSASTSTLPELTYLSTTPATGIAVAATSWSEQELSDNTPYLDSNDIELPRDPDYGEQVVGLLFSNISIPARARILYAYIQFTCSETSQTIVNLTISAQSSASPNIFYSTYADVSSRPLVSTSVWWAPNSWLEVGKSAMPEQSANLAPVLQDVIGLPTWDVTGHSIVVVIQRSGSDTGTGSRWARNSYTGAMPVLHIFYTSEFTTSSVSSSPSPSPIAGLKDYVVSSFAEELDGAVYKTSTDLELTFDEGTQVDQVFALRFNGIQTPVRSRFKSSYVQFTSIDPDAGAVTVRIWAEARAAPPAFTSDSFNYTYDVTSRPRTKTFVDWKIDPWLKIMQSSQAQRTPDISSILNELLWQSSWQSGNDIVLIFGRAPSDNTNNTRNAYSGEGFAPVLHVDFVYTAVSLTELTSPTWSEENCNHVPDLVSTDLEFPRDYDYTCDQSVGLRFASFPFVPSQNILRAFVQFQCDEISYSDVTLRIRGQKSSNPSLFSTNSRDLTGRTKTTEFVDWSPEAWSVENARDLYHQTPDISLILREIMSQPGWASGRPVVLIFERSPLSSSLYPNSSRWAESGSEGGAPSLNVVVEVASSFSFSSSNSRTPSQTPSNSPTRSVSPSRQLSPSTSLSPSPSQEKKKGGGGKSNAGVAAGVSVGVIAAAAIGLLVFCRCRGRSAGKRTRIDAESTYL
eukprot:c12774_g1_i1.p1 GENE.c12774_g1_i1~~c12774_g1_i1.p1  ORF type:complete len:857 (+),score=183.74 c12774_g1_i1:39-2609(+)